MFSVSL